MIQSSHRFGLAASSPNSSESSLAGWAAVLGFTALTLGPFGLLTAHPPNWIQTNLATRGETEPVGLIESCTQGVGAPPQTTGRLRRKNVAGGSAPRPLLGLRLRPRWGSAPNPVQEGSGGERGLGRSPSGGLATEPPVTFLRSPCVHDSIKPAVLVRREEPNLPDSSLAGGP